jgi:hypothetical protein
MMSCLSILSIAFAAIGAVVGQAMMNKPYLDILAGRSTSDAPGMTWRGPLYEGGEEYILTGTLEVS